MDSNNFFQFLKSKKFTLVIVGVFGLAFLVGVFSLGVAVGYHKARFSYAWGEQYDRNFGGSHHGIFGFRQGPQFMDAHGTAGSIIKIDGDNLIIKGQDNVEKIVVLNPQTTITKFRDILKKEDLKTDNKVVVIGDPDDQGHIVAKFIRVLP